jgi:uncharacterized protein
MQNKSKIKEFVINLLKENLSEFYYYHNYRHTLYVLNIALEIGNQEHCNKEELDLLTAAALWHDTGYIKSYKNHEEESCKLARAHLPEYGYSVQQIAIICGMIMATKIPQTPNSRLEEILADADLEYMGTSTFDNTAEDLFRELKTINPDLTHEKWNEIQISFLSKHHYFTKFCKEFKEPVKLKYLEELKKGLKKQ